jgi:hypothetical protein
MFPDSYPQRETIRLVTAYDDCKRMADFAGRILVAGGPEEVARFKKCLEDHAPVILDHRKPVSTREQLELRDSEEGDNDENEFRIWRMAA